MATVLILEPLFKVLDKFFRCHAVQLVFIHAQGIGHCLGILEPLLQQCPGHFINLQALHVRQFGPLEMVGEHLIEQVEVSLAFHQDGPRGGVELVQRGNKTVGQGPVQGKKGRGADRYAHLFEFVEKSQEHGQNIFRRLTKALAR